MQKVLNQKEIDALFRAAQKTAGPATEPSLDSRKVVPFEMDQTGRITKTQVQSVSMLHESFARNLSHSVGAYLRVMFETHVVSIEQVSYMEFLQRIPDNTYLAAINFQPLNARGLVHLDLSLAFPMIDLLLGGKGKRAAQERDLTEIEAQILESVIQILARELQSCWQPVLDVQIGFEERQVQTQVLQLLPSTERVLALLLDVRTPDARGQITLVLPAVVSSALLRRLSQHWSYSKPSGAPVVPEKVRNRILGCLFPVELLLPAVRMSARDLLEMRPGSIMNFHYPHSQPVHLTVGGRHIFTAFPVRAGEQRAACLLAAVDPPESAAEIMR